MGNSKKVMDITHDLISNLFELKIVVSLHPFTSQVFTIVGGNRETNFTTWSRWKTNFSKGIEMISKNGFDKLSFTIDMSLNRFFL